MRLRYNLLVSIKTATFGLLLASICRADLFDLQDINADGVLSGKEVVELKILDQDADGEVSRTEYDNGVLEQRKRMETLPTNLMKQRDADGDGFLSRAEFAGLEYCDANLDGRVTEAELRERLAWSDIKLEGKTPAQIREIAVERFGLLDLNKDERLTGSETHGSTHFDLNSDSRILKEEFIVGLMLSDLSTNRDQPDRPTKEDSGMATTWFETVSILDGVSFRTPQEPTHSVKGDGKEIPKGNVYICKCPDKKMMFELDVIPMDEDWTKDSEVFFNAYRDNWLKYKGSTLLKEKSKLKQNFPCNSLLFKEKNGTYMAMVNIVDENRLYHVKWQGVSNDEEALSHAEAFVESIKLIDAGGAMRSGNQGK